MLGNIIHVPHLFESSDSIVKPSISSICLSFELDNNKYSIKIDEQNSRAKLLRDDKEYKNITIKKECTCFMLYEVKEADERDFLDSMLSRFCYSAEQLKFQFGRSILQLFITYDLLIYNTERYHELIELSKDKKIGALIDKVYEEFKKCYNEFKRCSNLII